MPPSSRLLTPRRFLFLKAVLFVLCLVPAALCVRAVFFSDNPPSEPIEFLTRESGEQALRLLVITLAMTPLRLLGGWQTPVKLRRMFGLYAFFYALCHFSVYLFLDLQLDFSLVWDDIVERKYITVGFTAFLLLLPLAATSNKFSIRRLGTATWSNLHRAVYAIGFLGALHFLWIKRGKDIGEPLLYALIIFTLVSMRLPAAQNFLKRARRKP